MVGQEKTKVELEAELEELRQRFAQLVKKLVDLDLMPLEAGDYVARLRVPHDVTVQRQLEDHLTLTRKMEIVGRVSGGIARELNEWLAVILGFSTMALEEAPIEGQVNNHLQEIRETVVGATDLTQKLLTCSRRPFVTSKPFNLNDLVVNLEQQVHRTIGEGIELTVILSPDPVIIKADSGQIERVLMNLVTNARDAMPQGGKLTIQAADVNSTDADRSWPVYLPKGKYVLLTVKDTGVGISSEIKSRLFEPFSTTKEVDLGTGLGLFTCYGIVQQCGGYIGVCSEQGQGTSINIFLPLIDERGGSLTADVTLATDQRSNLPGGKETVLLVEDDPLVRSMVSHVLHDLGYTVLEAAGGVEALAVAQLHQGNSIDLLLTNVGLLPMQGEELANRLLRQRPSTRVLFISDGMASDLPP